MVKKTDLRFIRDEDCRNRIHRLLDRVQRVRFHGGVDATDFFDPYTVEVAVSLLKQEEGLFFHVAGGYEQAERKRILFTFGDASWLTDDEIVLFRGEAKGVRFQHREILGSLMGLGLDRGKFGDIVIHDDFFFIFMIREVEKYVLSQLLEIGRERIRGEFVSLEALVHEEEAGEKKRCSAASFRLDAVVAALIPTNRTRAQEMIKQERVKINHRMEKKASYLVSPGDLISIRGTGRFRLGMEWRESKKGRIHFEAEKY